MATGEMNHVERFRALCNFQPVDRLPRIEWAMWWDKTIQRWKSEGLPAELNGVFEIGQYFGLDPYYQLWFPCWRPTYPPMPHGQGPMEDMDKYLSLKKHLFPDLKEMVASLAPWQRRQDDGEAVVWITLSGFFAFPRMMMGIERHLYAFYDQPELMHRMNQDLMDFHLELLREVAKVCRPAFATFMEDMSYNLGPMLSRGMFEEFLAPYYRQLLPALKEMGTTIIIDTDGDCTELIPWLTAVGVDGVLPLERQAGVDAAALRRAHPRLLMIGHFDKMTMPHGESAMRKEFQRLKPVIDSGGFIPSVDHQTPPGVSMEQYRCFLRLLDEYTTVHSA